MFDVGRYTEENQKRNAPIRERQWGKFRLSARSPTLHTSAWVLMQIRCLICVRQNVVSMVGPRSGPKRARRSRAPAPRRGAICAERSGGGGSGRGGERERSERAAAPNRPRARPQGARAGPPEPKRAKKKRRGGGRRPAERAERERESRGTWPPIRSRETGDGLEARDAATARRRAGRHDGARGRARTSTARRARPHETMTAGSGAAGRRPEAGAEQGGPRAGAPINGRERSRRRRRSREDAQRRRRGRTGTGARHKQPRGGIHIL